MKEYLKPELGVYSLRTEERFAETCNGDNSQWIWGPDPSVDENGNPLYPVWTTPNKDAVGERCEFQNKWIRMPVYSGT